MIAGRIDDDGTPLIILEVAGKTWAAVVDSGFNGDVELPRDLMPHVKARYIEGSTELEVRLEGSGVGRTPILQQR